MVTMTSIHDSVTPKTVFYIQYWYKDVKWECYNTNGEVVRCWGMYLICDGGYLRWVTLICPYAGTHDGAGRRGYFNGNLESVRKDVAGVDGV